MTISTQVTEAGEVAIVTLSGDLAHPGDARSLRDAVVSLLDNGRDKIIVDFANVNYADEIGVCEFIACYKRTVTAGGSLKLLRVCSKVMRAIEKHWKWPNSPLEVFDDVVPAVNSFQKADSPASSSILDR